jgi:transposase-like protein
MKEVDFIATHALCEERCLNVSKLARKHEINKNSMIRYLRGKLEGKPGQGVYGQIEDALKTEGLLVFIEDINEEQQAA